MREGFYTIKRKTVLSISPNPPQKKDPPTRFSIIQISGFLITDITGIQSLRRTTSYEDDLVGRKHHRKRASREIDIRKMHLQKENLTGKCDDSAKLAS